MWLFANKRVKFGCLSMVWSCSSISGSGRIWKRTWTQFGSQTTQKVSIRYQRWRRLTAQSSSYCLCPQISKQQAVEIKRNLLVFMTKLFMTTGQFCSNSECIHIISRLLWSFSVLLDHFLVNKRSSWGTYLIGMGGVSLEPSLVAK